MFPRMNTHLMLKGAVCALITFQVVAFSLVVPDIAAAAEAPPAVKADTVLVADLKTGRIFYEKDSTLSHIPASLTKIMTLYVVFDEIAAGKIALDDAVPISEKAWATEGSKMFVMVGTQVRLEDLIKGITVMSGNDAGVAVAEYVGGNLTSFVDMMNKKAKDLGMSSTHFVDPHGLSDDNRTTASDLLTLVRSYTTVHPEALQYHLLKEFQYTAPGDSAKAPQFNRNRLLWTYPGTYGLKTGFTTLAGYNMVALVERSGLNVAAIVLGSAKGMSTDAGEAVRTELVTSLLDWVYMNYSYVPISEPGTVVSKVRVWKSKDKYVEAIAPGGLGATVEKGQEDKVQFTVNLDKDLAAPITAGSKVGEAVFTVDGQEVGRIDLVAKVDIPRGNIFRVIWDSIAKAFSRAFTK